MDQNLRDLLELAVGEPPAVMTVEAVRRRGIRRRMAQVGAVGLAFALVAGLGASLAAGAFSGNPVVSDSGKRSGPPRYYVQQYFDQRTRQEALAIRATATGRITGMIGDPRPGVRCGGGNVGFTAAGNRTFFLICVLWRQTATPATGHRPRIRRPGKIAFLESLIYRFQVTPAGRVSGFSPVKGGVLKGVWADRIAAAADGSEVAAEVLRPGPSGLLYTNTVPEGIFVIDTRTGARALWRTGPYRPGTRQYAGASDISFARDGSELVVFEARCKRGRYQTYCGGNGDRQVRAYAPAARGGSLETGQVLLRERALKPAGTSLFDALIAPDGSALTAVLNRCPRRGTCTLSVARIAVGTGRVRRVLYLTHTGTAFQGVFDRFFSSDPTGRYLILDAGAGSKRVNGWIHRGRLVPLVPADGNAPDYEAW